MKKIIGSVIVLATFLWSSTAAASYANAAKIEYLIITADGTVFFRAGPQVNALPCSPNNEWAFQVVGVNASGGRALLATLLAAQAQGKSVLVAGTGSCELGTRETTGFIVAYTN